MSKSKNNWFTRLSQTPRTGRANLSPPPTNVVAQLSELDTEKVARIGPLSDALRNPLNAKVTPRGITFGTPSSSSTKSTSSGSEWSNLFKQATSSGVSSVFSGTFGSIGGLGSLISGLVGLFGSGGKSTPPPLVRFQLPDSQQQTVYVNTERNAVYQGSVVENTGASSSNSGIYASSGVTTNTQSASNPQWIQDHSSQIAQAVKNAILNSNSLNDVIAEI